MEINPNDYAVKSISGTKIGPIDIPTKNPPCPVFAGSVQETKLTSGSVNRSMIASFAASSVEIVNGAIVEKWPGDPAVLRRYAAELIRRAEELEARQDQAVQPLEGGAWQHSAPSPG